MCFTYVAIAEGHVTWVRDPSFCLLNTDSIAPGCESVEITWTGCLSCHTTAVRESLWRNWASPTWSTIPRRSSGKSWRLCRTVPHAYRECVWSVLNSLGEEKKLLQECDVLCLCTIQSNPAPLSLPGHVRCFHLPFPGKPVGQGNTLCYSLPPPRFWFISWQAWGEGTVWLQTDLKKSALCVYSVGVQKFCICMCVYIYYIHTQKCVYARWHHHYIL